MFAMCILLPAAAVRAQTQPPSASGAAEAALVARGRQLFDDQRYEESIQSLSAALMHPSSTPDEKVEIYRLLALDFITLGKKDEAGSAVRGLLALRPDYELPASESPRFRNFFAAVRDAWTAEGRPGATRAAAPSLAPVAMLHESPALMEPNQALALVVHLVDEDHRVAAVRLVYRTGTGGTFTTAKASLDRGQPGQLGSRDVAQATIPAYAVKPPLVEYYLEALDADGMVVASRGDAAAPLRVAVPDDKRATWVLPVAVGGAILGAATIIGGLALTGVFSSGGGSARTATVSVNVR